MRKDILEKRELIEKLISENTPKVEIARQLNCKVDTLTSYLKKMGIDYKGNMGGKGLADDNLYRPAINYLYNGSRITSHKLKLKLIKDGIKDYKCEECGISEWMGKPAPLELDHIDGNHYNNELVNLKILCPNCHALTPTNCRQNHLK